MQSDNGFRDRCENIIVPVLVEFTEERRCLTMNEGTNTELAVGWG